MKHRCPACGHVASFPCQPTANQQIAKMRSERDALRAALVQVAELRETADARGDFHLARGIARSSLEGVK